MTQSSRVNYLNDDTYLRGILLREDCICCVKIFVNLNFSKMCSKIKTITTIYLNNKKKKKGKNCFIDNFSKYFSFNYLIDVTQT